MKNNNYIIAAATALAVATLTIVKSAVTGSGNMWLYLSAFAAGAIVILTTRLYSLAARFRTISDK